MTTAHDDYLTAEARELIERARALAPMLAERAFDADRDGRVLPETIQAIADAGLYRVLQAKRWGGYELDPRVFYSVQMELAKGCMSTAWMYGVLGVHPWQLALFPEQAQQDVWAQDNSVRIASTYMPTGKATPVEGGYRFSGRWGFSTGTEHCDWIFLGGLLPKKDGSGALEHTTFLLPKSDYRIEENWDVLGLRGTGSHDIIVDDVFVPEHRTQRTNDHSDAGCPGRATNPGWLYRIPFTQVFQRAVSSATGREFVIDGDLDVDLGRTITVSADRLRLGDAAWSERTRMGGAERVEVDLAPWPLLAANPAIPPSKLATRCSSTSVVGFMMRV